MRLIPSSTLAALCGTVLLSTASGDTPPPEAPVKAGEDKRVKKPKKAGDSVATMPDMIVTETATRVTEDVRTISQALTIIDEDDLKRRQPRTPIEMLKEEPGIWGVNVAAQGSPIIRGQIGNRVLYLWDGVRINNGALFSGPNGFFNQFPVGAVDRIEVVRGSGSVQYGSDAIGGVVNVFSKQAGFSDQPDFGGELYSRYGSNDGENTETFDFHSSGPQLSFSAGITRQEVGDYHGPQFGALTPSGFNALGGYANLAWRPTDNQVLRLSWIHNERTDVDSYVQSKLNASGIPRIFGPMERRGIVKLDYTVKDLGPWSDELKAYGYYQYYDSLRERRVETGTTFTNTTTDVGQDVFGMGLQNAVEWEKVKLVYGTDYRMEDLASSLSQFKLTKSSGATSTTEPPGNTPDGTYDVFDTFATLTYRPIERLILSAGGRFENSHIDSNPVASDVIPGAGYTLADLQLDKSWNSVTWNLGAVLDPDEKLSWAANVGTGFRAPTFSDVLGAGAPVFSTRIASLPSPQVDPERSITFEAGPRYHSEKVNASLTGYYTHLSDLVVSTVSGTVVIPGQGTFDASRKSNNGEGYITGVEMALSYEFADNWTFFGNGTYTYGKNTVTGKPLRFIPPLNGTVGVRYTSPSGRWWAEAVEVMAAALDRHSPDDEQDAGFSTDPGLGSPNTTTNPPLRRDYSIPGFAVTHLRGGVKVWDTQESTLDLTLDVNNVLNKSYREAYSQQQREAPGFGVVVGARLGF